MGEATGSAARPIKRVAQMLRESLRSVAVGMAIGVLLARLLQPPLVGLENAQFALVAYGLLTLSAAAVLAALLPAWRGPCRSDRCLATRISGAPYELHP